MGDDGSRTVREFVTVGERQVHYRRSGEGTPVILLHQSSRSSLALRWLITVLAARGFSAIALDTPGYGASDRLPLPEPGITDYAEAVVEAADALGFSRFGLYGAESGASMALEVAHRHPQRVWALVLDGLALHTDEEREDGLVHHAPRFEPRIDGGHMLAIWTRQRDQYLFDPWYRRQATTRRRIAMPEAQVLHEGVMDVLRAGEGYGTASTAVFRHHPQPALGDLRVPALVLTRDDDVRATHPERLPMPAAQVSAERVGADDESVGLRVGAFLVQHADLSPAPPAPAPSRIGDRITRAYANTAWGQLLVRHAGASDGRPLVMLHASPGSAESLVGLIERLAERGRRVVAFDTLGNGESDKPPWQVAEIPDYASVVAQALDALGIDQFDVYGNHTGAHIATEVAMLLPQRAHHLVIDGVAMFDREYVDYLLDSYTPPLQPRDDGTHLLWAWSFMRDQGLFWPWFNRTREGIRDVEPPSAGQLHRWYVEILKSGHTYPIAYRAAFRHSMRQRLPQLETPTLMMTTAADVLHDATIAAAALAPHARAVTIPADLGGVASVIVEFLDGR